MASGPISFFCASYRSFNLAKMESPSSCRLSGSGLIPSARISTPKRVKIASFRPLMSQLSGWIVEIDAEELGRVFAVPPWLRDLGLMSWLVVGTLVLLGGVVWLLGDHLDHRRPGHHRVDHGRRALPGRRLARAAPDGARRRRGDRPPAGRRAERADHRAAPVGRGEPGCRAQKTLHSAVDKLQGWLKDSGVSTRKANSAGAHASSSVSDAVNALLTGLGDGHLGAGLARGVPVLHRAQPVLPAQGRPADPRLDRAPHGRAAQARADDHGPDAAVAARLLRRRHGGGGLQRRRDRPRRLVLGLPQSARS